MEHKHIDSEEVAQLEEKLDVLYKEQQRLSDACSYWEHESALRDTYPLMRKILSADGSPEDMLRLTDDFLSSIEEEIKQKEALLAEMVKMLEV